MFKKYDVLHHQVGDTKTVVKLLTNLNSQGKAIVKVLKAGFLDTHDGAVLKGFNISKGLIKFSKVN